MPGPPQPGSQRVPRPDPGAAPRTEGEQGLTRGPDLGSLLVILGPTGTGKSATAVLVAERLGGEVVGCDARQVYVGLDAATAKPPREERRRVPHHLVDVADPRRDFTLADYVRLGEVAIEEIRGRGRVPIVVGGTGLYLRGLLRGIVEAPARDEGLRARLRRVAARFGPGILHRRLARLDPESAARLHPHDAQRVVRALEIALSGGPNWGALLEVEGTWAGATDRFASLKIGLDMDHRLLAERLARRVDSFFASGLVEETRRLLAEGVPGSANALKGIGYREVLRAHQAGTDPDSAREEILGSTRRYAKRQRTWFRREPGVVWLDAEAGPERLADEIVRRWHGVKS